MKFLISPKFSRAKALVRFSRYRAAQEAAPEGLIPEVHAKGVVDLSLGWSEAEPWVLIVNMRPALKERQRVASACRRMLG